MAEPKKYYRVIDCDGAPHKVEADIASYDDSWLSLSKNAQIIALFYRPRMALVVLSEEADND